MLILGSIKSATTYTVITNRSHPSQHMTTAPQDTLTPEAGPPSFTIDTDSLTLLYTSDSSTTIHIHPPSQTHTRSPIISRSCIHPEMRSQSTVSTLPSAPFHCIRCHRPPNTLTLSLTASHNHSIHPPHPAQLSSLPPFTLIVPNYHYTLTRIAQRVVKSNSFGPRMAGAKNLRKMKPDTTE